MKRLQRTRALARMVAAAAWPEDRAGRIATIALWVLLFLLYGSPLWTTYFIIDEAGYVRTQPFPMFAAPWMGIYFGLFNGRPLSYFLWGFYLSLATSWGALPLVRVIHFTVSCLVASAFVHVLRARERSTWPVFFLVLFLAAQPVIQIYFAVSMRTTYWLGAVCSAAAFLSLQRSQASGATLGAKEIRHAALLLLVGWTTFQATPFCGLTLLSYYALTASAESWPRERRAALAFLATFIGTMVAYAVVYKLLLFVTGAETYFRTDRAYSIMASVAESGDKAFLQAKNYLGPFEWWNYPLPIATINDSTRQMFTRASACVWLAVSGLAFIVELRRRPGWLVVQRYAVAFGAAGLTFLPLVADNFTARQNVFIACVPAVVLTFAACVRILLAPLAATSVVRRALAVAALPLLAWVCVGARSGFERGLIQPNARFYRYVVDEVARQARHPFDQVLILRIAAAQCCKEPCVGTHGYRISAPGNGEPSDFYRKIVFDHSGRSDFEVRVSDENDRAARARPNTLIIDLGRLRTELFECAGATAPRVGSG